MADIKVQADIVPAVTAGEQAIAEALELLQLLASGDQQQKRQIVRSLKQAKKAIKYANKIFEITDSAYAESKKYCKLRRKFELYD